MWCRLPGTPLSVWNWLVRPTLWVRWVILWRSPWDMIQLIFRKKKIFRKKNKKIIVWNLLNVAVQAQLFEFLILSLNLPSLSRFVSLYLLIFRPSISFCIFTFAVFYYSHCTSSFNSAFPKVLYCTWNMTHYHSQLELGCYPSWAYVFFDVTFGIFFKETYFNLEFFFL